MTSNVVELFKTETTPEPVNEFMELVIDWAFNNGIDTSTQGFRHDGAIIMSTLQSMLYRVK